MSLLGTLDIDATPALAALHKVSDAIEGFEKNVKGLAKEFAGFAVAFEAIHYVAEHLEGVMEMGSGLATLHAQTAESVHDLVIFQHALETTGSHAESARDFIFKLQNAIAGVNEDGTATAEAFQRMHTSADELRNLPLLEQLERLQKGLKELPQDVKVATLKDLFGFRFAAQAMPLLTNEEGLEHAKKVAEPLADLMERNAEKFDKLDTAMKDAGLSMKTFFGGVLEGLAPDATDFAERLASINFEGIGRTVGTILDVMLKLANVLAMLAPLIGKLSDMLASMNKEMLIGAAVGGLLGLAAAGPVGAIAGAVAGGFIGNVAFDHAKDKNGNELPSMAGLFDSAGRDAPVGALQRIGRGGGFDGGNSPVVVALGRTNQLLTEIRDDRRRNEHTAPIPGVPFPPV